MKQFGAILAALVMAAALTTGCSAGMKDGSYRAEYQTFDDHGWKDYILVTVSGGKITQVEYDSINAAGALKSADEEYRTAMEPVSGTYPAKYIAELEDQLVSKQEPKKVDTVTGATNSSDSFKRLAGELIDKGIKKGSTDTIVVS